MKRLRYRAYRLLTRMAIAVHPDYADELSPAVIQHLKNAWESNTLERQRYERP